MKTYKSRIALRYMLSLVESLNLLNKKFSLARFKECKTKKELLDSFSKMKKPVVVKVNGINHKSDKGGVILDIETRKELIDAYNKLSSLGESLVIQEQKKGVEIIVGLHNDKTFGQVVMVGIGGVYTELLKDVSFRICPVDRKEALSMIEELKMKKLLEGYRNLPKVDKKVLASLISKVSKLKKIKEMDLNPVIFNGKNYSIVDARIETI